MDREIVRLRQGKEIRTISLNYDLYNSTNKKINRSYRGIKVRATAEGDEENFEEVEETAKAYLIHEAIREETGGFRLEEIDKIKRSVIGCPVNGHLEVEIILEGIAVFKNR